jgi:hypothetical protein
MYKIGIVGHGPEHLHPLDDARRTVGQIVSLLSFQYGDQLVYNIIGEVGIGLMATKECFDHNRLYCMYLPYPPDETTEYWYDDQKNEFYQYYSRARAITTCYPNNNWEDKAYENLIDDSNFLVCFWIGKKQGKTFDAIKYALKTNKLVLNGLNDLRLVTNKDIKKIY